MYSTLFKLSAIDSNHQYHKYAFEYQEYKTSPPLHFFLKKEEKNTNSREKHEQHNKTEPNYFTVINKQPHRRGET